MANDIKCEVMRMKLIPLAFCIGLLLLGREYYKAIRHEFYEVWAAMDRRIGEESPQKGERK